MTGSVKSKLAALLLAVVLLAGCSPISSGIITGKTHHEGYYYTTTYCASWRDGTCQFYMPQQNYQPPTWSFDLKDNKDTGWVYVGEGTYNSYEIGDYYGEQAGTN